MKKNHSLISLKRTPTLSKKQSSSVNLLSPTLPLLTPFSSKPEKTIHWYPKWLQDRVDFSESLLRLTNLKSLNVFEICKKPYFYRDYSENAALKAWCQSCPFFKSFSELVTEEVCKKLKSKYFHENDFLIEENHIGTSMFLIVSGQVGVYKSQQLKVLMGSRNSLGEKALESNEKRNADVIAHTDVEVLELESQDYNSIILKLKPNEKYEISNLLKNSVWIMKLPVVKRERLAWSFYEVNFDKGEIIYDIGEQALSFFVIKEGSVKLEVFVTIEYKNRLPVGKKHSETLVNRKAYIKTLRNCKKYDFFGAEELVSREKRKIRASACEDGTTLLLLETDHFFNIFNSKERKEILEVYPNRPNTPELREIVEKDLGKKKSNYRALLAASDITPLPNGRNFSDREIDRKVNFARKIEGNYKELLHEKLLSETCFTRKSLRFK